MFTAICLILTQQSTPNKSLTYNEVLQLIDSKRKSIASYSFDCELYRITRQEGIKDTSKQDAELMSLARRMKLEGQLLNVVEQADKIYDARVWSKMNGQRYSVYSEDGRFRIERHSASGADSEKDITQEQDGCTYRYYHSNRQLSLLPKPAYEKMDIQRLLPFLPPATKQNMDLTNTAQGYKYANSNMMVQLDKQYNILLIDIAGSQQLNYLYAQQFPVDGTQSSSVVCELQYKSPSIIKRLSLYKFTNIKLNQGHSDNRFTLRLPKNSLIVDSRQNATNPVTHHLGAGTDDAVAYVANNLRKVVQDVPSGSSVIVYVAATLVLVAIGFATVLVRKAKCRQVTLDHHDQPRSL